MTIAAALSQPTFVKFVVAAPIHHERRREPLHRRSVAAATPERAARIRHHFAPVNRLSFRLAQLLHKPHAGSAPHATATVLPRVVAHLLSFRQIPKTIQAQLLQQARKPVVGFSASLLQFLPTSAGSRNQQSPFCISGRSSSPNKSIERDASPAPTFTV